MDLDCSESFKEMFYIVCLRRPFDGDGLEVMGEVEVLVGELFCNGLLAEL